MAWGFPIMELPSPVPGGGHGSTPYHMSCWSACPSIGQASAGKERMGGMGGGRPGGRAEMAVRGCCLNCLRSRWRLAKSHKSAITAFSQNTLNFVNYTWVLKMVFQGRHELICCVHLSPKRWSAFKKRLKERAAHSHFSSWIWLLWIFQVPKALVL